MQIYHANGKLLLTGEYVVLGGAQALAVPTKFGQSLSVYETAEKEIVQWGSFNVKQEQWFAGTWAIENGRLERIDVSDKAVAERLEQIFAAAQKQSKTALQQLKGKHFQTHLEFPNEWGLGTSSTLISLISQYLKVDAFDLLAESFGGSGYDIACAEADGPIVFQRVNQQPISTPVQWTPACKEQLCFVYLGQKQNSRDGIQRYRKNKNDSSQVVEEISVLTKKIIENTDYESLAKLMQQHEQMISEIIKIKPVQAMRFPDFPGQIKSLGAWGGDFVMVLSPWATEKTKSYFNEKGYSVVFTYDELILE